MSKLRDLGDQTYRQTDRPKVQNRYTPPGYAINITDGVFDFAFYGKTISLPKQIWKKRQRDDLIPFNKDLHQNDLQKHLRIQLDRDSQTCDKNTNVIIKYWDCFSKNGLDNQYWTTSLALIPALLK